MSPRLPCLRRCTSPIRARVRRAPPGRRQNGPGNAPRPAALIPSLSAQARYGVLTSTFFVMCRSLTETRAGAGVETEVTCRLPDVATTLTVLHFPPVPVVMVGE